jgi:hypothetical protein
MKYNLKLNSNLISPPYILDNSEAIWYLVTSLEWCFLKILFFYLKLISFIFLDFFDVLVLGMIFKK